MLQLVAVGVLLLLVCWRIATTVLRSSALSALPGPAPESWISGNLRQAFSMNGWDWYRRNLQTYGNVFRLRGMFGADVVFVADPLALWQVVVKDQHIFQETRGFISGNSIVFGNGLLATEGDSHRRQRKMLNPVFSTAHMRDVTPIMYPIVYKLRDAIAYRIRAGDEHIDVLYWLSRAALELIGQAGFGYSFDALEPTKDSHNPYTQAAKQFAPTSAQLSLFRPYIPVLDRFLPRRLLRFMAVATPHAALQKIIGIVDTMHDTSVKVYEQKKRAFAQGDQAVVAQLGSGKDIMSVLMQVNEKAAQDDKLSEDELLGQMNTFIFAGSDTTSSALSKTLLVLSQHPEAQERLRREVTEARQLHGDLNHDQLVNLPYLDAVCRETLRLEPPVTQLLREAAQDAVLKLKNPVKATDGRTDLHEIVIKKDALVLVGIQAFNRNKEIWGPDAEEWKPERWLSPLPKSLTDEHAPGIYSHMMTFFGGSRACIGLKFSQLEMKVVLSLLLEAFEFKPGDQEIEWLKAGIQVPIVKGQKDKVPRMPMKVSLVRQEL